MGTIKITQDVLLFFLTGCKPDLLKNHFSTKALTIRKWANQTIAHNTLTYAHTYTIIWVRCRIIFP